jgi:hypothetical protein
MSGDESSIINYDGGNPFECGPGYELNPTKIMFGLIILYFIYAIYFKTDTIYNPTYKTKTKLSNNLY